MLYNKFSLTNRTHDLVIGADLSGTFVLKTLRYRGNYKGTKRRAAVGKKRWR